MPEQVPKGLRTLPLVSVKYKNVVYLAPPKVSSGYENVITQVPLACTSGGANVGTWALRKLNEGAKSMLKTLIAPPGLIRTGKAVIGLGGRRGKAPLEKNNFAVPPVTQQHSGTFTTKDMFVSDSSLGSCPETSNCVLVSSQHGPLVEVEVLVEVDVLVEVEVHVEVDVLVEVEVLVEVDVLVEVEVLVEVDVLVEVEVLVEVDALVEVEVLVEVDVLVEVEVLVEVDVLVEVEVFVEVDVLVEVEVLVEVVLVVSTA